MFRPVSIKTTLARREGEGWEKDFDTHSVSLLNSAQIFNVFLTSFPEGAPADCTGMQQGLWHLLPPPQVPPPLHTASEFPV